MSATVEPPAIAGGPAWAMLGRELGLWAEGGQRATLWWRDDDAAAVTPALERLLALQAEHAVPLALAVIPDGLAPGLVARLSGCAGVVVIQHGHRHLNHAGKGEGAWELGNHRPLAEVAQELEIGRRRLAEAFGERFLPVLAPPWNRISERVVASLPALGFVGLTTFGARERASGARSGRSQRALRSDRLEAGGALRRHRARARRPDRPSAGAPARQRGPGRADRVRDPSPGPGCAGLGVRRGVPAPHQRPSGRRLAGRPRGIPAMNRLPAGIELRSAGPDDREAVVALLHERMSSEISLERWRRLFDYPWLRDKPDCGVVVLERGALAGYLGVIYADRRGGGRRSGPPISAPGTS